MASDPLAEARSRNGVLIKTLFAPYLLLGIFIMLLVPEGISESIPILGSLTSWAGTWIPSMRRYAAISPFPDAARLFILIMSVGFPFVAWQFARNWVFPSRIFDLRPSNKWFVVGSAAAIALLLAYFLWIFLDVSRESVLQSGGRGGIVVQALTQYRLGMAVIDSMLFVAAAGATGVAFGLAFQITRGRGHQ